jgi:hypothetical protein
MVALTIHTPRVRDVSAPLLEHQRLDHSIIQSDRTQFPKRMISGGPSRPYYISKISRRLLLCFVTSKLHAHTSLLTRRIYRLPVFPNDFVPKSHSSLGFSSFRRRRFNTLICPTRGDLARSGFLVLGGRGVFYVWHDPFLTHTDDSLETIGRYLAMLVSGCQDNAIARQVNGDGRFPF